MAPNVLARDFSAQAPNVAWVGDITYLTVASEWALDEHMRTERGRLTPRWSVNKGEGQSAPSKVRWLCPVPRGGEPVTEEFRASQNRADVTCTRRLRFPQTRAHGCYRLVAASEADAKYAATRETTPSARQRRYSVKFGENHHDDVF